MKVFQSVLLCLIGLFFSSYVHAITIQGELSFPNAESVTPLTRSVLVRAENPLNSSQQETLFVSVSPGPSEDFTITLPDNGHDWIIRYFCSLCSTQALLREAYVGASGMVTDADDAFVFNGSVSHSDVSIDVISGGISIEGTLSFPNQESVTAFTRNVVISAQDPLNSGQSELLIFTVPDGEFSGDYSFTLPENGHDWILKYVCTLCNEEGILTEAYVGASGMVTTSDQAQVFDGSTSHTDINIDLIGGVTIEGILSFPNAESVTNFTRNVVVFAENPLNPIQTQLLNVSLNVGQESSDYSITLPDNGHSWILRYICTLCNEEGILTQAYVGPSGMVTAQEQALVFDGSISHTNVNIDLISGVTIEGELSFPSADAVTEFTRNVVVFAEDPLDSTQTQLLNVSLDVGQISSDYSITLPDNGNDWVLRYVCTLCNQEGVLTQAYVGPSGMVTTQSEAFVFDGGVNHTDVNIDLIGGVIIQGLLSFPSASAVTEFTRNVIVVAQDPLNTGRSELLAVTLELGQSSRPYAITLPDNGHDWILKYVCTLCNQEGILTQAYVGEFGMVTEAEQAFIFSGGTSQEGVNIDLIGSTPPITDMFPLILDLLLNEN